MFRLEKISRHRPPTPRAGRWALLALLAFAGFASPVFAADPPPANTNWVFEATNHLGQWIWETRASIDCLKNAL